MTDRELLAIFEKYAPQHGNPEDINNAIEALRARLAQPEPVIHARKENDLIVADLPQVPRGSGGISKREWVGLTDAERELAAWSSSNFLKMAESIEARLKEKNT